MGYDCGFDMSPRLTTSPQDITAWCRLLFSIQREFARDDIVASRVGYYEFQVGEHPKLPRDGTRFLTFSSKISGELTQAAEPYIRKVCRLARAEFGDRIKFWNDLYDAFPVYDWREINESIREYGSDEKAPWSHNEDLNALHDRAEAMVANEPGWPRDRAVRAFESGQGFCDQSDHNWGTGRDWYEDRSRTSSPKDLTACDKECGYCGHCPY